MSAINDFETSLSIAYATFGVKTTGSLIDESSSSVTFNILYIYVLRSIHWVVLLKQQSHQKTQIIVLEPLRFLEIIYDIFLKHYIGCIRIKRTDILKLLTHCAQLHYKYRQSNDLSGIVNLLLAPLTGSGF